MKNISLLILVFSIILISCSKDRLNKSSISLDVEYFKNDTLKKNIDIIDINIREKAWIKTYTHSDKDFKLNAVTANNIDSEKYSDFTNWSISGKSNNAYTTVSGGYGWGYGYGYGYAYNSPTIEILFSKKDVPDIDRINLGPSKDSIFISYSYNDNDIKARNIGEFQILWINLDNIPVKLINKLSYIKIEN